MQFLSNSKIPAGSKVFVRADLDVPLDKQGHIIETYRLDKLLPTLHHLLEQEVTPVIAGHIGRPKDATEPLLSTDRLKPYFDSNLGEGAYILLENLRFNSGENAKSEKFAQELAGQAEYYVNESFATCHRDSASLTLLPGILPAYAGLQLEKELENLEPVLNTPREPLVALVAGIKKSKKEAIYDLAEYFDFVLVGGGLKKGDEDPDLRNVIFPLDYNENGMDIGPRTVSGYKNIISDAQTIVWAGPMGAYDKGYTNGSARIAEAVVASGAYSIVGGGDTITCLNQLEFLDHFDFVSTGGGAMLDFLTKKKLPGLEALGYYE